MGGAVQQGLDNRGQDILCVPVVKSLMSGSFPLPHSQLCGSRQVTKPL